MSATTPTQFNVPHPTPVVPAPYNPQTQSALSHFPSPHNPQFQAQSPQYHQQPPISSKLTAHYNGPFANISPPLTPPSQAEIENKPWKYLGYPSFAIWSASSKDALVLRRFNAAHARVILFMQDQIAQKEEELESLDRYCVTRPDNIDNGTFRYDMEPRRYALLDDLRVRLKEYSKPTTFSGL